MTRNRQTLRWQAAARTLIVLGLLGGTAAAQGISYDRYFPLGQNSPPGVTGRWNSLSAPTILGAMQAVRVELPRGGRVSFYSAGAQEVTPEAIPGQARLAVGHTYRLRIGDFPEFEGIELYPTIEVLDQLHPPAGLEDRFPIPVPITESEIRSALRGRLVTKVIYLEAPRRAIGVPTTVVDATRNVPATTNVLAEADYRGRPMLILRIGGRMPSASGTRREFFGSGGPVVPSVAPPTRTSQVSTPSGRARLTAQRSGPVRGT